MHLINYNRSVAINILGVFVINTTLQVIINLFAAALLIVIAINENQQFNRHLTRERLFLIMVYTNIILCLSDAIAWSLENTQGAFYYLLNQVFTSVSFIAMPILTYTWFLYVIFTIYRDDVKLERYEKLMKPIIFLGSVVIILNTFTHYLFFLDENNCYHRGPLFYPYVLICFSVLVFTFVMIVFNRKKIRPDHFVPMVFFVVPTIITSLLAILLYGIALSWVGTTLAIFIIYLFIQSQRLGTDYLTNLNNRRQLNEYLTYHMRGRRNNEKFGIIMMDINQFKQINDSLGHAAGDEVLIALAKILKASFRSGEFISRYGGDEFIVVMSASCLEDVSSAVKRFQSSIDQFNKTNIKSWKLSVSIGYDLYDPALGLSFDVVLNHVDSLMYREKSKPDTTSLTVELKV